MQASLSRAYKRLEARNLIRRARGQYELTNDPFQDGHGFITAFLDFLDLAEKKKPNTLGAFSELTFKTLNEALRKT